MGNVTAWVRALGRVAALALVASLVAQERPAGRPHSASERDKLFAGIDAMAKELAEITGLRLRQKLRYATITRDEVKKFLEERIRDEVKDEEIRAEELVLKKFGFAPADFNLKKTTIEMMTEQAAAFYDFRRKKLFMLDGAPSLLQEASLVHEVAHALADQHFRLDRFIQGAREDDDASLARMAVMEGQATWLMSEFLARKMGQSLKTSPALVEMMQKAAGGADGQFPVFDAAPLYLRESLIFPYAKGMALQHAVYLKSGTAAFTEMFRRPPATTQQVLHASHYFAPRRTVTPQLPEPPARRGYRVLAEGSMGEFDHAVLIRQYQDAAQADALAPKWTGGLYRLWEHRKDKRAILTYGACWESDGAARDFFAFYLGVLRAKWKRFDLDHEDAGAAAGRGDDGRFRVELVSPPRGEPRCLTSIEGLPE